MIKKIRNSHQSGVTLLLSVMIMSGLVLIVTSVAVFTVSQIRTSRAQLVSESAFHAAKAGSEEGLWAIKRTGLSSLPDCPTTIVHNYSSSKAVNNYCKSFEGGTFNITSGTATEIYLYNPNDPGGDVDLSEYPYNSITINNQSGGFSVDVTVRRFDDSISGISPSTFQVTPSSTQTVNISALVPDSEARMIIRITSTNSNTVFVDTDRGLPTNLNLSSTACSSKTSLTDCANVNQEIYTRKIEVGISNGTGGASASARNVTWTNIVGVSTSGNSLTKTAPTFWGNAGASSVESITSGDGYIEFSTNGGTMGKVTGLSNGDVDQTYSAPTNRYGINTNGISLINIFEQGALIVNTGIPYAAGDVFRIAIESGVVRYYHNGALIYTSTLAPAYPLIFDTALNHIGGQINNARIYP